MKCGQTVAWTTSNPIPTSTPLDVAAAYVDNLARLALKKAVP